MEYNFIKSAKPSSKTLLFVGGSNDNKDTYSELINLLKNSLDDYNFFTYTYSDYNYDNPANNVSEQIKDIFLAAELMISNLKQTVIDIFCTSMGAYSTTVLLNSGKYDQYIKNVIYFDPADYYLNKSKLDLNTWSGNDSYNPDGKTVSMLMKSLKGGYIINVAHLTLKNCYKNSYISEDYEGRGINHSHGVPRLNTSMVKGFYKNLPKINKGKYLEFDSIPHGFCRDGNVKSNQQKVAGIITDLLI